MGKKRWYRINFKKVRRETKRAAKNSASTLISGTIGAAAGFVKAGPAGAAAGATIGIATDQKRKSEKLRAVQNIVFSLMK